MNPNGFSLGGGWDTNTLVAEIRKNLKGGDLAKANTVTTATGLVNYDLQAPAKNLYPVNTPLRNVIPRVKGDGDTATRWKSVYGIGSQGAGGMAWVPEGSRAALMTVSAADQFSAYSTFGNEINLTYEAWSAATGFEDEKARNAIRLLQQTMLTEEVAIYGGNNSLQLGTPATPTVVSANTGGTIPAATYVANVVLLTAEGFRNWQLSGASIATGIPNTISVTPPVDSSYTVFGGSSNKSANSANMVISGTGSMTLTATPKAGAVAYAWYVGTAGNQKLEAVTTVNTVTLTALAGTGQALTAITGDHSYNNGTGGSGVSAFNGILYAAFISSGLSSPSSTYLPGAYVKHLATGAKLTASGRGTVNEIDAMLLSMWNNYQVSPSVIYVNAQELRDITTLCLTNNSGPLLQYFSDPKVGYAQLMAGGNIEFYFNPFAMNGGTKIPIKIHPFLPPGTLFGWAENLPMQYQSPEVPNVVEMHVRRDYYEIDWPPRTRLYEMGVYCEETCAVYAPFACGVIDNITPLI